MTEKCFDEGTIQAFLDGELETERLEAVARHTALCDVCAFMLSEAEEESALAFTALGDEFNSLVPTERIRTSLYAAIGQIEKPRKSFWQKIFGIGGFSLSNPSLAAFASLLLVFGIVTTLYIHKQTNNPGVNDNQIARATPLRSSQTTGQNAPVASKPPVELEDDLPEVAAFEGEDERSEREGQQASPRRAADNQPKFERAVYKGARGDDPGVTRIMDKPVPRPPTMREILPGEESYVKTIATLNESVSARKDAVLRPSERVAFEKDLAVVNDAITKMRREVRKNPRNEAAKQVLRSSYQNKIDLLNSVAERSELMATMR